MSIHKSFKSGNKNQSGNKSVLPRSERIEILIKRGKMDASTSKATGLPKTKK